MEVLLVSTSYPRDVSDWKGRFNQRIISGLSKLDYSRLFVWGPPGQLPDNVRYCATASDTIWLEKISAQGGIAHIIRSNPPKAVLHGCELLFRLHNTYKRLSHVDIYHVNWLQNALSLPNNNKPLLVTTLGTDLKLLGLPGMKSALRHVFSHHPTIIAPNNTWMIPVLKATFGNLASVRAIKFGIDNEFFEVTRTINEKPRIWLTVSRITKDKIGPLLEWGENYFGTSDELHVVGPLQDGLRLPAWVKYHRPTSLGRLREYWFPRASALVTLSSHSEGLPQIVIEAMAAGVPVIASPIAAHRSVITHKDNGWIASSPETFCSGLDFLSDFDNNLTIGSSARKYVSEQFGTWKDASRRYQTAHLELLEKPHHEQ